MTANYFENLSGIVPSLAYGLLYVCVCAFLYDRIIENRLNLRRFSNTKCLTKNFGFSCRRKSLLANNLQRFQKFSDFQGLDFLTDTRYLSTVRDKFPQTTQTRKKRPMSNERFLNANELDAKLYNDMGIHAYPVVYLLNGSIPQTEVNLFKRIGTVCFGTEFQEGPKISKFEVLDIFEENGKLYSRSYSRI